MSCKYCGAIKDRKRISINQRSTYAIDNMCENICNNDCSDKECEQYFMIGGYENHDELRISLEWHCEIKSCNKNTIIKPFSESIKLKYCPFCGEQLSTSEDTNWTYTNLEILEE